MAMMEPGQSYDKLVMVGVSRNQFMARTNKQILVGNRGDLPTPNPKADQTFAVLATPLLPILNSELPYPASTSPRFVGMTLEAFNIAAETVYNAEAAERAGKALLAEQAKNKNKGPTR